MGNISQMKNLTPQGQVSIPDQIECINLAHFNTSTQWRICNTMECPLDVIGENIPCNKCIGDLRIEYLKTLQPNLDSSNLVQTITTWNILLK